MKRKYNYKTKYHLTAVDKKLLRAVADDSDVVKVGYHYGFSKRKRVHIINKGYDYLEVKIVSRRNDDWGRPADDVTMVTISWEDR